MKEQQKNIISAFFLLVVFSINNIAGFACSIGIDMGYNTNHHAVVSQTHQKTTSNYSAHKAPHHHSDAKEQSEHNDCCSDEVTQFTQLDKSLVTQLHFQVPVFILSNIPRYSFTGNLTSSGAANSRFQFVRRSCFLNDMNIQTAIRRFQI